MPQQPLDYLHKVTCTTALAVHHLLHLQSAVVTCPVKKGVAVSTNASSHAHISSFQGYLQLHYITTPDKILKVKPLVHR